MLRSVAGLLLSAAILMAQPSAALRSQSLASDCAIDGWVVNAATGEPIARARVMLMGPGGQRAMSADNSGHWSFTGIPCGQTQVQVSKPGFLPGSYGQPRAGSVFRPLILASGSPVHDVRIALNPQAVVSGKVTDDQGDPMMNVQISALSARVVEGHRIFQPVSTATTNDLGEYRIASLQPGKYIICAHSAGPFSGFDTTDGTTAGFRCYPGPPEGGIASAMDVKGTDTRADFTISRVPAVRVRGTLSGAPRGAGISLMKRGVNTPAGRSQPGNVRPDGAFEFAGVTAGSYMLTADFWEGGKRLVARVPLEVGSSDIDGVTIALEPAFSLSGTVKIESNKGQSGPLPQFGLGLRSSEPLAGGAQLVWGQNHQTFTFNQVIPGNYRLDAFPTGAYYLKRATLGGRDFSKEEIPVTQGGGPIEVVLGDDGGSVEGQIEDSEGKPVMSWIMVLPDGRPPRNVMSGPDGHFTVTNLAPGNYQVYAWDDVQQVEYANPEWMRTNASGTSVTVAAGQTAQVKLHQQSVPTF